MRDDQRKADETETKPAKKDDTRKQVFFEMKSDQTSKSKPMQDRSRNGVKWNTKSLNAEMRDNKPDETSLRSTRTRSPSLK